MMIRQQVIAKFSSLRDYQKIKAVMEALPWGTFAGEFMKNNPYRPEKKTIDVRYIREQFRLRRHAIYAERMNTGHTYKVVGQKFGISAAMARTHCMRVIRELKWKELSL